MTRDRFNYQSQRLSQARSSLMLPHPRGEERSIADAFFSCHLAFEEFDVERIGDENPRQWVRIIKRLMDTEGVGDPNGEGTWVQRARSMTMEEKREFSIAVDELASWFRMMFWSDR